MKVRHQVIDAAVPSQQRQTGLRDILGRRVDTGEHAHRLRQMPLPQQHIQTRRVQILQPVGMAQRKKPGLSPVQRQRQPGRADHIGSAWRCPDGNICAGKAPMRRCRFVVGSK